MFKRIFQRPLVLRISGCTLKFNSPCELEFALRGRIGLPATKIAHLASLPDNALLKQAEAVRDLERRVKERVARPGPNQAAVHHLLLDLDPSFISRDHDWRSIMQVLRNTDLFYAPYKQVACEAYAQYLSARRAIIKTIHRDRQLQRQTLNARINASNELSSLPKIKERLLFDLSEFDEVKPEEKGFSRLPKGKAVEIHLESKQVITLMLGRHRFSLAANSNLRFIDANGAAAILSPGRTTVGRDADSDIVINTTFKDVSRNHLLIETLEPQLIKLTDLSSFGTFVPSSLLEGTDVFAYL